METLEPHLDFRHFFKIPPLAHKEFRARSPIDWSQDPQALTDTWNYLVEQGLGPEEISTAKRFTRRKFLLADGTWVSGKQLLYAVARFECPSLSSRTKAFQSLGGKRVVEVVLKKYLAWGTWDQSEENLQETWQFILAQGLNPKTISTSKNFTLRKFTLRDGTSVSGKQLLYAVAALERPDLASRTLAFQRLGGKQAVAVVLQKYLAWGAWDQSETNLRKTWAGLVEQGLGPEEISTSKRFTRQKFSLSPDTQVSGKQLLYAVAQFECPDLPSRKAAFEKLGGKRIVEVVLEKYLAWGPWDQNEESLRQTWQELVDGGLQFHEMNTSKNFTRRKFILNDGTRLSGKQLLYAVAHLECPHLPSRTEAFQALGGKAIVELVLKKYLGKIYFEKLSFADTERFIQEHQLEELLGLFSQDPGMLTEVLSFLKAEAFQNQDVREFVHSYVGLQVERGEQNLNTDFLESEEKRQRYLAAMMRALESEDQLDRSELNFQRQLDLLKRLCRASFESKPMELIEELLRGAEQAKPTFAKKLQRQAAEHFQRAYGFQLRGMRTEPYGYQKEGAYFLATHDDAILADEAGMGKSYQAIAAVQSLDLKRVLWVTTAANKETLREEILEHSTTRPQEIAVVISGDPEARLQQLADLSGVRYVITNYETLVALQQSHGESYQELTKDLAAVIVDEAQLTDHPEALRTQAIRGIATPRRWLLTATPYQNKPERIWTLLHWLNPERYPNEDLFRDLYTRDTSGLRLLHSELAQLLLRRSKREAFRYFEAPSQKPFFQQLQDPIPRIPRMVRIPSEERGTYELAMEQAELIAWMVADFYGWAEHHNQNGSNGFGKISLTGINPLLKFETIEKVIYQPERFGISIPNPLLTALDQSVEARLARGEKIILWAWNTSIINALEKRYEKHGVCRIDSNVVGTAREQARHDFQENAAVRILVANYRSGGVGLTLSAAHGAIFVQLPKSYPQLYQAEHRSQRLIGPAKLHHAKERVEIEWLVPQFPQEFLQNLSDSQLKDILSHGTLVEQTRARLQGGEKIYQLLLEGFGREQELEHYFKQGLFEAMGLLRQKPLHRFAQRRRGRLRRYAPAVGEAIIEKL